MKSKVAFNPLLTSAGLGPAKIPITSPANFVAAFPAPAYIDLA